MVAIGEFACSGGARRSPLIAATGAVIACACDPAYAPLVAVTGVRAVVARGSQWRGWVFLLPVVGALLSLAVVWAATVGHEASLWRAWVGLPDEAAMASVAFERMADAVGPMAATASLAGLVLCVARHHLAGVAVAVVAAMAAVISLRVATVAPAVPILAALCGGVGLARFAATTHSSVGQAFVGATAGFMLVVASAWRLVATM